MRRNCYFVTKRIFDIILSIIGIVIASPIILIASIFILIDDPDGGPFYSQIRVGKDRKPFKMHKLRTMWKNADKHIGTVEHLNESDGPVFKIKDDPRITKVGRVLRKTSIDELPQLVDVLSGNMSLVGPRPPLPREVAQYKDWQMKRLSVKPGITCYWQIVDNRNDVSFDDWVKLDIKYIDEMCFTTDLKILFKTVFAVLKMNGR